VKQIYVRFYAGLNSFLPPWRRGHATPYTFEVSGSVKDMVEALGVPHTEIDLILVNGDSVDWSYRLRDEDRVSVYPPFRSIDVPPLIHLSPQPLRQKRFVLDTHLGRLAAYLRMLGFDTLYSNDYRDEDLARISSREGRILLTRDLGVLKRNLVTHGYWIRATLPREQVIEIVRRFDLAGVIAPFRRCVHCNGLLHAVSKNLVLHRLLPETKQHYNKFYVCEVCNQVYWKGSHYRRMSHFVDIIRTRAKQLD
jgi:uncharacterized protein with PIN domain